MNFFDMGFGEILLILIVALIFWGPARLPEIARTLGRWVGTIRKAGRDMTTQIKREMEEEEQSARTHHLIEDAKKRVSFLPPDGPGETPAETPDTTTHRNKVEAMPQDASLPENTVSETVNEEKDNKA